MKLISEKIIADCIKNVKSDVSLPYIDCNEEDIKIESDKKQITCILYVGGWS